MTTYTQAQLTALRDAAAKGVTKLRAANGEEVVYRSLDEMWAQIAVMEAALSPKAPVLKHYPSYDKGV